MFIVQNVFSGKGIFYKREIFFQKYFDSGIHFFSFFDGSIVREIPIKVEYSQCGSSDSVTGFSVLSNTAGAQKTSCLGLCLIWAGYF